MSVFFVCVCMKCATWIGFNLAASQNPKIFSLLWLWWRQDKEAYKYFYLNGYQNSCQLIVSIVAVLIYSTNNNNIICIILNRPSCSQQAFFDLTYNRKLFENLWESLLVSFHYGNASALWCLSKLHVVNGLMSVVLISHLQYRHLTVFIH